MKNIAKLLFQANILETDWDAWWFKNYVDRNDENK
jgi:hypothetical protein